MATTKIAVTFAACVGLLGACNANGTESNDVGEGSTSTGDDGGFTGSSSDTGAATTAAHDAGSTGAPVDACMDRPEGVYADCGFGDPARPGDPTACGATGAECVQDDPVAPSVAVCSFGQCSDDCDCPAAPASGDATPRCGEILPGGGPQCHLACDEGQACPDGMFCYSGFICAYGDPSAGTPYGDCINGGIDACGPAQECIVDDPAEPTTGVCGQRGCASDASCPPAPATGNARVSCAPLMIGQATWTCQLDCSAGRTCPDGMSCFRDGHFCTWDLVP